MQTATVTMDVAPKKAPPIPRNGVNTPAVVETIFGVVANQPALAKFQFRASNQWMTGTHSRTTMKGFFGASGEQAHHKDFTADGDHPAVLCGADQAPTPVEWVLHALATCLTAGIANIAAVRGVTLHRVESKVEGDIDLLGIFGLSKTVRNGYQNVRITFEIEGDAPAEKLREIVEQSRARSAVYDVITNGIPVEVSVKS
jgi:uncharacterized OsmC-like protein